MNQSSSGPDNPGSPVPGRPSFIADVNVGKLARWLRVLGYDTLFINPIDDGLLVDIALREGRIVLTRDTHIPERRLVTSGQVRVLVVEGDQVEEQLRFVERALGITASGMLSRCLDCNVLLEPVDRSEVAEMVPPYVYRTQARYHICPSCGKIYWPGTHWARMLATARRVIKEM